MKFLIIATARSGTTLLTTFLHSHPDLTCYAEEGLDFINNLKNNEGANIKYGRLRDFSHLSKSSDFKLIHLIRKDLLYLALSKVINKYKKKLGKPSHIYPGKELKDLGFSISDSYPNRDILINSLAKSARLTTRDNVIYIPILELFWKMLLTTQEVIKWNKKLKGRALTIFYEDITNNNNVNIMPQDIADKICDYIEVKRAQLKTPMKKVNPRNYEDYISNWNQIKNLGKGLRNYYEKRVSA